MKPNTLFLSIIVFFVFTACSHNQELVISFDNPNIEYMGRIDTTSIEAAQWYWSGTSVKINFEGDSIQALFSDNHGDNYYNVILDADSLFIFRPDTFKKYYTLASGLDAGKHSLEIFKRTEWDRGTTLFYGFKILGDAKLLDKDAPKNKAIEFYGNSITAGYAVDDFSGSDRSDSIFTNNWLSYANLTARHYNANYSCICKSGIGITISWFPLLMPEIYDRLNPNDTTSCWDFSLFTPNIVVINLFQNDSWLVNRPERAEFKTNFGTQAPSDAYIIKAYQDFVVSVRGHYPQAKIICALGTMDATRKGSKWPGYIQNALANLNDPKIYTHFMSYKETPGHPSVKEQESMASSLIKFIDEEVEW
jgi:hypothetical protein